MLALNGSDEDFRLQAEPPVGQLEHPNHLPRDLD
jgi:hypothetical protein